MARGKRRLAYLPKKGGKRRRGQATGIHQTARWKRLSYSIRRKIKVCEAHRHYGYTVGVEQVDHIIRLADFGAPFNRENLMGLCKTCHEHKSRRENQGLVSIAFDLDDNFNRIPENRESIFIIFKDLFKI